MTNILTSIPVNLAASMFRADTGFMRFLSLGNIVLSWEDKQNQQRYGFHGNVTKDAFALIISGEYGGHKCRLFKIGKLYLIVGSGKK